ncbi:MAG: hypothetical protein U1E42_13445 [Rhodospirillales bacterium]
MSSRSLRPSSTHEQHRCCGALISIGAYGDWHLCEACETMLSARHARRRATATGSGEPSPVASSGGAGKQTKPRKRR